MAGINCKEQQWLWMGSHDIDELCYMHQFFLSFYEYWPDDGLFRPKQVANIWNNEIKVVVTDAVHTCILVHSNIVSLMLLITFSWLRHEECQGVGLT
jgi:hypothetical protein